MVLGSSWSELASVNTYLVFHNKFIAESQGGATMGNESTNLDNVDIL